MLFPIDEDNGVKGDEEDEEGEEASIVRSRCRGGVARAVLQQRGY